MRRLLASSRYVIAAAAIGTFLSGSLLLVFGVLSVIELTINAFMALDLSAHAVEELAVDLIKLTDAFLLGTVLYIVALGLYELFFDPDLPLPPWLIISDLDDLKEKLIGVIVVLLGVTFLGEVVSWNGETDILRLGIAVALVIVALSVVFYNIRHSPNSHHLESETRAEQHPPSRAASEREPEHKSH